MELVRISQVIEASRKKQSVSVFFITSCSCISFQKVQGSHLNRNNNNNLKQKESTNSMEIHSKTKFRRQRASFAGRSTTPHSRGCTERKKQAQRPSTSADTHHMLRVGGGPIQKEGGGPAQRGVCPGWRVPLQRRRLAHESTNRPGCLPRSAFVS